MDDSSEGYKIGASLLGGGAVGSVITAFVTSYRNRVQPVAWRAEKSPLFTPSFVGSPLNPSITVSDGANDFKFGNLHVADLQLINRGNKDMATFTFGLTLGEGDHAVHVEPYGLDRHHVPTFSSVKPSNPSRVLDFTFKPFNRGDSYKLKVLFVAGGKVPGEITIGSSEAVRFTEIGAVSEALAEAASSYFLDIGPFMIGMRSFRLRKGSNRKPNSRH